MKRDRTGASPKRPGAAPRSAALSILVAVDGSPASRRAARHAAKRAMRHATVHLLYVQRPLRSGEISPLVTLEMARERRRNEEVQALRAARAALTRAKVAAQVHVETGPVAETIVRCAQRLRCSEIIMGTRGRHPLRNILLGSVASRVVRLAQVPVTLLK